MVFKDSKEVCLLKVEKYSSISSFCQCLTVLSIIVEVITEGWVL